MGPLPDDPRHPTALPPPRLQGWGRPWAWVAGLLLLALAWKLASVLLLVFAAVLVALALRNLCAPIERRWPLPPQLILVGVVLGLVLLLVGGAWLVGANAAEQLQALRDTLPQALRALREWLAGFGWGRWLLAMVATVPFKPEDLQQMAGLATGTLNAAVGAVGAVVLALALGIYLAADISLYRRGALRLVPPAQRALASTALEAAGRNLSRWLVGQGVTMLAVGMLTAAGLALIGMPLVLSLSLIAALLEFVPYFGPVATGVLVVSVALTVGEKMALWALLVCLAVQQVEAYLVQPLAQRWAVRLPPVLGLVAVLVFGVLFGLPGVLLAVPLMVLTVTLIEQLYVRQFDDVPPARQRRLSR